MCLHRQTLPPELIREVVQQIDGPHHLVRLASLSKTWQHEAERILYESVTLTKRNSKYQALTAAHLLTLCSRVGRVVMYLDAGPIQKTCKSLKGILASLPNLRTLKMEFKYHHRDSPFSKYVPSSPPFSLRYFSTNHNGSEDLSKFLKTQLDLEELDLTVSLTRHRTFALPEMLPKLRVFKCSSITLARQVLGKNALTHPSFLGDNSSWDFCDAVKGQRFPTIISLGLNSGAQDDVLHEVFPNVHHLTFHLNRWINYVTNTDGFTKLTAIRLVRPPPRPLPDEREIQPEQAAAKYFAANRGLDLLLSSQEGQLDKWTEHWRDGRTVQMTGHITSCWSGYCETDPSPPL